LNDVLIVHGFGSATGRDSGPGPRSGTTPRSRLRPAQETVPRIVRVNVEPGNRVHIVVAIRLGALAGTCASSRSIERSYGAVRTAHEAAGDRTRSKEVSHESSPPG